MVRTSLRRSSDYRGLELTSRCIPILPKYKNARPLDAQGWTDDLAKLPCFTFRTLYQHFTERSAREVDDGETVTAAHESAPVDSTKISSAKFRSFRGLDKGFRFFKDGHVHKIKLFSGLELDGGKSVCYVRCEVLPSMRKDRVYQVRVCCTEHSNLEMPTDVRAAYCICPASLAGSCNHVGALLYALEDFVRKGLREETPKACTSKLMAWNQPRARKMRARKTSEVFLKKEEYSTQEAKRLQINKPHYDPAL